MGRECMNDCSHIYFISNHWEQASPTGHGKIVFLNSLIYSTNTYVFIMNVLFSDYEHNCFIWKPWEKIPKYKREPIHLSFQTPKMNYC